MEQWSDRSRRNGCYTRRSTPQCRFRSTLVRSIRCCTFACYFQSDGFQRSRNCSLVRCARPWTMPRKRIGIQWTLDLYTDHIQQCILYVAYQPQMDPERLDGTTSIRRRRYWTSHDAPDRPCLASRQILYEVGAYRSVRRARTERTSG